MRKNKQTALDPSMMDPVMGRTIDKLLKRETTRMDDMHRRINGQIDAFEAKYKMSSEDFQSRYDCEHEASLSGSIGDDMDFIEWAATLAMREKIKSRMEKLARVGAREEMPVLEEFQGDKK